MTNMKRIFWAVAAFAICPSMYLGQAVYSRSSLASPMVPDPISVYDNWSVYDELSDNVPLTEKLSMAELDNMLRLRKSGVRFDYYAMDAFWFDPDGGYRAWKKPNWPEGPDRWIKRCQENGIRPGLWFSTNTLVHLNAVSAWRDSLNQQGTAMSMFEGGFLPDFMKTLQYWYDRGVRMYLFDFADLGAATPQSEASLSKEEIVRRNSTALREALLAFRHKNPDVILEAFNGFGGDMDTTDYPFPFKQPIDLRWLQVFDSLYCGDPRPSDVPASSFWRSLDLYSDHQMRRYEQSGVPLERIDTTSFMPGVTSTIYRRGFQEWKGSLILMMARGGWINTTYGNLELLSSADAAWFGRVQSMFLKFQSEGRIKSFGGVPGEVHAYGFGALDPDGSVYVVVNPTESVARIEMPTLSQAQKRSGSGRILFRDAGFVPQLNGTSVTLGSGQMAVVGFGKYAQGVFDLGTQPDVVIPKTIKRVPAEFHSIGKGLIQVTIDTPPDTDLRLVMQQYSPDGSLRRTWAGGDPGGVSMGKVFVLKAEQGGKELPIHEDYDRVVWSGLSWAEGEIKHSDLHPGKPLVLTFQSTEKDRVILKGQVYSVTY